MTVRVEQICSRVDTELVKNGVKTSHRLPSSKRNKRVCNEFRGGPPILFDRQIPSLAAHVKLLQNVIEDRVQGKYRTRRPVLNGARQIVRTAGIQFVSESIANAPLFTNVHPKGMGI